MKSIILFFISSTSFIICVAQNLVPNGDFETYSQCPSGISQVEQCTNWIQPSFGTPDYFHNCATNSNIQIPFNLLGYQYPSSGNAYTGILTYVPGSPNSIREYVEVALTTTLSAGTCYYFEMYANLSNKSKFSTYDVGVYFSDTLIDGLLTNGPLSFIPQLQNIATVMFDTLSWTKVSGIYTATGGEQYLMIGNFYTDSLTHPTMYNPAAFGVNTYLYIDDVSLTVCTGLVEFNKLDINVAPNPFTNKLVITTNNTVPYELLLTDITGRQVLKQNLQGNAAVQTGYLNKGIYFATLLKKEKVVTVKVVKK